MRDWDIPADLYGMLICAVLGWSTDAKAHEHGAPNADWYKSQQMTPETRSRLQVQYWSCCDHADVVEAKFRLIEDGSKYGLESYEFLERGVWQPIPPDLIQRKPTPDGKPVLFRNRHDGKLLCFIIDQEGI